MARKIVAFAFTSHESRVTAFSDPSSFFELRRGWRRIYRMDRIRFTLLNPVNHIDPLGMALYHMDGARIIHQVAKGMGTFDRESKKSPL